MRVGEIDDESKRGIQRLNLGNDRSPASKDLDRGHTFLVHDANRFYCRRRAERLGPGKCTDKNCAENVNCTSRQEIPRWKLERNISGVRGQRLGVSGSGKYSVVSGLYSGAAFCSKGDHALQEVIPEFRVTSDYGRDSRLGQKFILLNDGGNG